MIRELKYEYGILMNPTQREYGNVTFRLRNEEYELYVLGELPGPNGTNEYVLECITNMHKVMRGGLVKAYAGYDENDQKIYKDWPYATIGSGEGCTVHLKKDECVVMNLYNDTEIELNPQCFYQMMCDWEAAILRWERERIDMMLEEKKKPYFREYLLKMDLSYLKVMLKREEEIIKEEALMHNVTEESLREKLKTEVLEKIIEHEKSEVYDVGWSKQKERLVDEYVGIEKKKGILGKVFG